MQKTVLLSGNELSLTLRKAAANAELATVKELITNNINIDLNAPSSNGNTALLWATINMFQTEDEKKKQVYLDIILLLIEYNCDDTINNNAEQNLYSILFAKETNIEKSFAIINAVFKKEMLQSRLMDSIEGKNSQTITNFSRITQRIFRALFAMKAIQYNTQTEIKVISLGCGIPLELFALHKYFKLWNKTVTYVGIDINENQIKEAQPLINFFPNTTLIAMDFCSKQFLDFAKTQKKFNFGMMRNPEFSEVYKHAFIDACNTQLPDLLVDQATLYFSFYSIKDLTGFSQSTNVLVFGHKKFEKNSFDYTQRVEDLRKRKMIVEDINELYHNRDYFHCMLVFNEEDYLAIKNPNASPTISTTFNK